MSSSRKIIGQSSLLEWVLLYIRSSNDSDDMSKRVERIQPMIPSEWDEESA